eukprot:3852549-Pleurochrysis_carterae.AAC.1
MNPSSLPRSSGNKTWLNQSGATTTTLPRHCSTSSKTSAPIRGPANQKTKRTVRTNPSKTSGQTKTNATSMLGSGACTRATCVGSDAGPFAASERAPWRP